MSKERDILKSLLLKEELAVLDQLQSKLLSEDQFTDEVAKVLSNAIKRSQKQGVDLERALEKPIKKGVIRAFSEGKQTIIDALLPIMGQLIRKTVTNSIKQFVSDINRTLELGFSAKALKWRWQALRTDKSFAEIVFQKTIRYQVNEIFLINKENGLLIEHAGTEGFLKDSNAISAMLTAIQSFIGDSFESEDANLQSAQINNQDFIIATGPKVYLAAVVKGNPTERLKQKFQEIIEDIHANFSATLLVEETYQNNVDLNDYLHGKLVIKNLTETKKEIKIMPWVLLTLVLIGALVYWSYNRQQALNDVIEKSSNIEGFYLQKVERESGGYKVYGLLDPLAKKLVFADKEVIFITKPYISLDKKIINQRIDKVLSQYERVDGRLDEGRLMLSGSISYDENQLLLSKLYALNGVDEINNQLNLIREPQQKEEDFSLLFEQINDAFISIPNNKDKENNKRQLNFIIKNLQLLQEKHVKIDLTVIGISDCFGLTSDGYSLQRAQLVKNILIESNIDSINIVTRVNACTKQGHAKDLSLLGVKFIIKNSKRD